MKLRSLPYANQQYRKCHLLTCLSIIDSSRVRASDTTISLHLPLRRSFGTGHAEPTHIACLVTPDSRHR
jgi:hypothetical protein